MDKSKGDTKNQMGKGSEVASEAEGARRATGASDAERGVQGALASGQRWTVARKREVVLRIFRGESLDKLSRELGVEIYRLEKWRDRAMSSVDEGLKKRKGDPVQGELDVAMKRIGELTMENELLYERCRRSNVPFPKGRSRK